MTPCNYLNYKTRLIFFLLSACECKYIGMCMHACIEAGSSYVFDRSPQYFYNTGFPTELRAPNLTTVVHQGDSGICLSPSPQCRDWRCMLYPGTCMGPYAWTARTLLTKPFSQLHKADLILFLKNGRLGIVKNAINPST